MKDSEQKQVELDEIEMMCKEKLEEFREKNDLLNVSKILRYLGLINSCKSRFEKAIELFDESLEKTHELKNQLNCTKHLKIVGRLLLYKSYTYFLMKNNEQNALSSVKQSLDITEQIEDHFGTAVRLVHLATIHLKIGNLNEIKSICLRAIEILEKFGTKTVVTKNEKEIKKFISDAQKVLIQTSFTGNKLTD